MRNFRVRFEIDIDRVEHNPFPVRRWHWRADTFQLHHVLKGERVLRARASARSRCWSLAERRRGEREKENQDFPMHDLPPVMKRKLWLSARQRKQIAALSDVYSVSRWRYRTKQRGSRWASSLRRSRAPSRQGTISTKLRKPCTKPMRSVARTTGTYGEFRFAVRSCWSTP